ncbi:beta-mannosidase-like isoform X2 [Halichondria panicea]|uniref:beta-mannosidase-like isoform X2 n=1 Tax=Halichondria panicea TaxID=6063 RepID=UPI00312B4B71
MTLFLLILSIVSLCSAVPQQVVDLTGSSWTVADTGGRAKVSATVPGQVHLDLLKAKVIEDPYDGWNDWSYQWIAYSDWTYSREFQLPKITDQTVLLKVEGLDTVATISIDGSEAGRAVNMHRTHYFDITRALVESSRDHTIEVTFNSSANYSLGMAGMYPYKLNGGGQYFNYSSRNFVRKTQSDFGWDWGPAFVPSGITGNISVIVTSGVYVTRITPKTFFSDGLYGVNVTICTMVGAKLGSAILSINYTLETPKIGLYEDRYTLYSSSREVCISTHTQVSIDKIEPTYLWWPNGVSNHAPSVSQAIVSVNITSSTDSADVLWKSEVTKNIGFRRIDLIQDAVKSGETFYFQLTTEDAKYPIFAKGSNFIPMDAFVNRANQETTRRLLTSAVQGNQNMIRIWGGGLYQPDWFYDLCDELGIMVWQEFMFADALYPRDKDFLMEVELEVQDVVRRLGNHPSIVLWSGNNENQDAGEKDSISLVDYTVLYDSVVRATLWLEDTTRIYWPSSPSNGVLVDDSARGLFIQRWGDGGSSDYGDTHRYNYDDFCTDDTKFPTPRFASEFGFQSYPSFASLAKISTKVDWSNDSPLMNHRQHHPNGNQEMDAQMKMFFRSPNNSDTAVQFQDFVYLSQVVQAVCIKAEAEHYRRYISVDDVFTRGTLYWQLNDIWQAQSWASLEWSGQWKLLHYYMSDVYRQLSASSLAEDNEIGIYIVNDAAIQNIEYNLVINVLTWKGENVRAYDIIGATAKAFTGKKVWSSSIAEIFAGTSTEEAFLHYTVMIPKSGVSNYTGNHFPANFSKVALEPATITPSHFTSASATKVMFNLSSNAVAPFVYLESRNVPGRFSDNGFTILKGGQIFMSFESWEKFDVKHFSSGLSIRSLQDTYSDKLYEAKNRFLKRN